MQYDTVHWMEVQSRAVYLKFPWELLTRPSITKPYPAQAARRVYSDVRRMRVITAGKHRDGVLVSG